MGILDFFKPSEYRDPVVGHLTRRGRRWQGVIRLGAEPEVPLLLAGSRTEPGEASLGLAHELGRRYAALRPSIARALFEHYEPYSEAGDAPRLGGPEQVWGHVWLVRVLIEPIGGVETVELAYRTEWDTEHTVGARFQEWALTELNGSVI